jgi:hypothetical protein
VNGPTAAVLPKGANLARYDEHQLAAAATTLNNPPRETLEWKTPAESPSMSIYDRSNEPVLHHPLEPYRPLSISVRRACVGRTWAVPAA